MRAYTLVDGPLNSKKLKLSSIKDDREKEHFEPATEFRKEIQLFFPDEFETRKNMLKSENMPFPLEGQFMLVDFEIGHFDQNKKYGVHDYVQR